MMNSAPTPTQSLMARKPMAPPDPKTGVTPDLLTLLSKMAVDKAAEHWQQQQALAQGQTPPTVAQTAGQKAEQVMQQQLVQQFAQNHPAQSQQQQAQAPGGLQAAAQVQGAAEGGLTKLQTNLPTKYAGGGIVAFNGGGYNDEDYFSIPGLEAGTLYQDAIRKATEPSSDGPGFLERAAARRAENKDKSFWQQMQEALIGKSEPANPNYGNEQKHSLASPAGGFDLAGTSLDKLVQDARAADDPKDKFGALNALAKQFGNDAVDEAIKRADMAANVPRRSAPEYQDTVSAAKYPAPIETGGLATAAAAPAQSEFERVMRENLLSEAKRGRNVDRDEALRSARSLYGDKADKSEAGLRALLEEMEAKQKGNVAGRSDWRDLINDLARGTAGAKPGKWEDAVLGTVLAGEQRQEGRKKEDMAYMLDKLKLQQGIDSIGISAGEKLSAEAARAQSDAEAGRRSTMDAMTRVNATDENNATRRDNADLAAKTSAANAQARLDDAKAKATERDDRRNLMILDMAEKRSEATAIKVAQLQKDAFEKDQTNTGKTFDFEAARKVALARALAENQTLKQVYESLGLPPITGDTSGAPPPGSKVMKYNPATGRVE